MDKQKTQPVVYGTYRDPDRDMRHDGAGMVFQILQENGTKPSIYHNEIVSTVVFQKVGEPEIVVDVYHKSHMQADVYTRGTRAGNPIMTLTGSDFIRECSVILAQGVGSFETIRQKIEDEEEVWKKSGQLAKLFSDYERNNNEAKEAEEKAKRLREATDNVLQTYHKRMRKLEDERNTPKAWACYIQRKEDAKKRMELSPENETLMDIICGVLCDNKIPHDFESGKGHPSAIVFKSKTGDNITVNFTCHEGIMKIKISTDTRRWGVIPVTGEGNIKKAIALTAEGDYSLVDELDD